MTNNHKEIVITTDAPGAIGPYSQAVKLGNVLYTSGQLGLDPVSGAFPATVEEQTERSLLNVKAILEAAGTSMDQVIKTTVFLKDMNDFLKVNEIYGRFLLSHTLLAALLK